VFARSGLAPQRFVENRPTGPVADTTRTQNSLFGIRNLREPRELSQPNQQDWSALEDDFRTFLLMPGGSESLFQQFTA
jgi:hypothetical protein